MAWTQIEEIKVTLTSLHKRPSSEKVAKSPGVIISSELISQIEEVVSEIIRGNDEHPRVLVEIDRIPSKVIEVEQ